MVEGQAVLISDHTADRERWSPHAGCRDLHQDSETQSKPNYFRGHFWGAIGLLIGTVAEPFLFTLVLAYPSGIHTPTTTGHHRQKPRDISDALGTNGPGLCCRSGPALHPRFGCVFLGGCGLSAGRLCLVCGMQGAAGHHSCASQEELRVPTSRLSALTIPALGRPRQYGDKVKLYEVFDYMHLFEQHTLSGLWRPRRRVVLGSQSAVETHGRVHPFHLCADQSRSHRLNVVVI